MKSATSEKPMTPKYERLANELRREIRDDFRVGDRFPTLVELRARFGVSNSTMERVYALLEQDGLIAREQGRGTFVTAPRKRAASGLIGFIGINFRLYAHSSYVAQLAEGIFQASTRAGRQIVLLDEESVQGIEKVDGVLICSPRLSEPVLHKLPSQLPCVSLLAAMPDVPSVVADDEGGARDAVRFLMKKGHRRIACLMEENAPLPELRLRGYRAALAEAGLAEYRRVMPAPQAGAALDYRRTGYETMRHWLRNGWKKTRCSALFCQNDRVALGAVVALQEAGLRVPDDVSVIGFDGSRDCEECTPRLTSVAVPLKTMGELATQTLIRRIEIEHIGAILTALPTSLSHGDSVKTFETS